MESPGSMLWSNLFLFFSPVLLIPVWGIVSIFRQR